MRWKDWKRGSSRAFAIVGVGAAAFVIGHGFSAQASDTAQVERLALQVKRATAQIQRERLRNIRDGCRGQNERHGKAVAGLNALADQAKAKDPAKATQIDRSVVAFRKALIDTLAEPHPNCARYARSQVAGS